MSENSPSSSVNYVNENFNAYNWYWGNVEKEVVASALENQRNGTFVVRDASTKDDFTLTLRVNGTIKLIKIFVVNGKYGFTPDLLPFSSLLELIQFYRHQSLKEYNERLDICLMYPLINPNKINNTVSKVPLSNQSDEVIKCKLEGFHAEYERISRHNDQLNDQRTLLNVKCQIKKLALDAYIKVENIFYEKIDKLERSIEGQPKNYLADFYNNIELQKERIVDLKKAETLLSNTLNTIENIILRIDNEIEAIKPRMLFLWKKRNIYRDILLQRRVQGIDRFLKEVNFILDFETQKLSTFLLSTPTPWGPQTWFTNDSNKENSIYLLNTILSNLDANTHSNGIFLIRPSHSRPGYFVLVITMNYVIHNCLIEYRDSSHLNHSGYGFLNTDMFFSTLIDFVRYYSQMNLREHNTQLDTVLYRPAFL